MDITHTSTHMYTHWNMHPDIRPHTYMDKLSLIKKRKRANKSFLKNLSSMCINVASNTICKKKMPTSMYIQSRIRNLLHRHVRAETAYGKGQSQMKWYIPHITSNCSPVFSLTTWAHFIEEEKDGCLCSLEMNRKVNSLCRGWRK